MDNVIDTIVKSVIVFALSISRAMLIGAIGVIACNPIKRAIYLRVLYLSRSSFSLSGRAMLVLSCICISLLQRHWPLDNTAHSTIQLFSDKDLMGRFVLCSTITAVSVELAVLLMTKGPFNRRYRIRVFDRRKSTQRSEILRYVIAICIFASCVAILIGSQIPTYDVNPEQPLIIASFYSVAAAFILIPVAVGLYNSAAALFQIDIFGDRFSVMVARLLICLSVPLLLVISISLSSFIQGIAIRALFLEYDSTTVQSVDMTCKVKDGNVSVSAVYYNPSPFWYRAEASDLTIQFNGYFFDHYEIPVIKEPLGIDSMERHYAIIPPKTVKDFQMILEKSDVEDLNHISQHFMLSCKQAKTRWIKVDPLQRDPFRKLDASEGTSDSSP